MRWKASAVPSPNPTISHSGLTNLVNPYRDVLGIPQTLFTFYTPDPFL